MSEYLHVEKPFPDPARSAMTLIAVVRSQRPLENRLQLILRAWLGRVLAIHDHEQGRRTRQGELGYEYAIGAPVLA